MTQILYRSCLVCTSYFSGGVTLDSNILKNLVTLPRVRISKLPHRCQSSGWTLQWVNRSLGMWQTGGMAVDSMEEGLYAYYWTSIAKEVSLVCLVAGQSQLYLLPEPSRLMTSPNKSSCEHAWSEQFCTSSVLARVQSTSIATIRPSRIYFNVYVDRTNRRASWKAMHFTPYGKLHHSRLSWIT